jgi:pimeloyl-ACP methyl ester carboxylesterase
MPVTTRRMQDLTIDDHTLTVPLMWGDPADGRTIDIHAAVVTREGGGDLPYLVFLQGGPGHEAPRAFHSPAAPSWLDEALEHYRVVLLDQRGTGLSTPVGRIEQIPGHDVAAKAEYLTHFRADAIVRDCELLREHLGVERWSLLGQSFGGFCSLHYLSTAAGSIREAFITGGLPPVGRGTDDVYAATYARMRTLTARLFERFPEDRGRLATAYAAAGRGEIRLPDGAVVSPRRLRGLGYQLGMDGGALAVHYLLEQDPRSPAFATDLAGLLPFAARNPLYAVIHESSYADGVATRWSAERTLPDDDPLDLLTGEHVFGWHFTESPGLAPYAEVANRLAEHEWPRLYDAEKLSAVDVPVAAAIYADDPYVDRAFSEQTAALLPNARTWVTETHLHNALRVDGEHVLGRLIELARESR